MVESMNDITAFLDEFEETLTAQTQALLDGFEEERLAVFEAVGEERASIFEAVEEERDAVMGDLDARLLSATVRLEEVGRGLIDHFFVRLIEVLAVGGVVSVLTVLLVLSVLGRRERGKD